MYYKDKNNGVCLYVYFEETNTNKKLFSLKTNTSNIQDLEVCSYVVRKTGCNFGKSPKNELLCICYENLEIDFLFMSTLNWY